MRFVTLTFKLVSGQCGKRTTKVVSVNVEAVFTNLVQCFEISTIIFLMFYEGTLLMFG